MPLRSNVTGPKAAFSDLTDWQPYGDKGDQVRGGTLRLRDSQVPDEFIDVRVVGRMRHRTGKVAWYATRADVALFPDATIIDLYFERWPLQELVFRDGNGRVHLDAHYGYGKRKVDNVAVIDKVEKLQGRTGALAGALDTQLPRQEALAASIEDQIAVLASAAEHLEPMLDALDAMVEAGQQSSLAFREKYATMRVLSQWVADRRARYEQDQAQLDRLDQTIAKNQASLARASAERDRLASMRQVFTVDCELDQVMTAFKLTYMSLCAVFVQRYLGGRALELDTMIRGVFTLPGERVRTRTTETIRIWRQPRDRQLMPLVEEACRLLTARGLVRDERRLTFELADRPEPPSGGAG